jgi:hypothetical protein
VKPESGSIIVRQGLVIWSMNADEARELADFMEECIENPADLANRDVAALREAADLIDGGDD